MKQSDFQKKTQSAVMSLEFSSMAKKWNTEIPEENVTLSGTKEQEIKI